MDAKVTVATDDPELYRRIRDEAIRHNITVLSAGLSAGLSVDLLAPMCVPLGDSKQSPKARELTEHDKQRIAAADAKRRRRALKLAAHPAAQKEE